MTDAPTQPDARRPDALVATGTAKAGLVWAAAPGQRPQPFWHVWNSDGVGVVVGGDEQPDPGWPAGTQVEVRVPSKDTGGRLLTFVATVTDVRPDDPLWDPLTFALKAGRLNARDAADLVDRWAEQCRVLLLVPSGPVPERPGQYDDGSGAATPAPTSATTDSWRPFHAGGRRRRRRRL